MAPVVLVFALRQNGRVGSQYPKAQEFEAANATLGWLLGQALKIHLGEGGITPAARDMCHWSTAVQNEEHPAHGFCSSDDRHTSPAKYMSISTVIRWIDFESAWRGWSNSPACADLCHLSKGFFGVVQCPVATFAPEEWKQPTQMRRSMMITYCNPAILLCWRFYEMLCVNVYQMNSFGSLVDRPSVVKSSNSLSGCYNTSYESKLLVISTPHPIFGKFVISR